MGVVSWRTGNQRTSQRKEWTLLLPVDDRPAQKQTEKCPPGPSSGKGADAGQEPAPSGVQGLGARGQRPRQGPNSSCLAASPRGPSQLGAAASRSPAGRAPPRAGLRQGQGCRGRAQQVHTGEAALGLPCGLNQGALPSVRSSLSFRGLAFHCLMAAWFLFNSAYLQPQKQTKPKQHMYFGFNLKSSNSSFLRQSVRLGEP